MSILSLYSEQQILRITRRAQGTPEAMISRFRKAAVSAQCLPMPHTTNGQRAGLTRQRGETKHTAHTPVLGISDGHVGCPRDNSYIPTDRWDVLRTARTARGQVGRPRDSSYIQRTPRTSEGTPRTPRRTPRTSRRIPKL